MKNFEQKRQNRDNLLRRINAGIPGMTRKAAEIANYTLSDPVSFVRMTSKEICAKLAASEPTLIRFCQNFGYSGLAEFRIDLAIALAAQKQQNLHIEPHASDRRLVNFTAKQKIARAALHLIRDDRTIIMDNGSTVEQLAALLAEIDPIKIMTTGLGVAQNALEAQKHAVMLTGGLIRPGALSLTGRISEASIREMRFDSAYLGTDSIDPQAGLSTFLEEEAHQTRAMVKSAHRVVVLADKSKFNKPSLHWICDIRRIHTLVTDAPPDAPELTILRERGVTIVSTESSAAKAADADK